jgi:hypothetical protein
MLLGVSYVRPLGCTLTFNILLKCRIGELWCSFDNFVLDF